MKQIAIWTATFMVILIAVAVSCPAQTIDNPTIKVIFKGDRAEITLKSATANAAIGELVDAVKVKDFKQDGNYYYASVYDGNVEANGMKSVWYFAKEGDSYSIGFCDGPAGDQEFEFSNFSDAKKQMKIVMRQYYALNGTLDPVVTSAR